ncbi:MAG: hypothetical protein DWI67_00910 [Chloroflexi bacterium]|nr:MAG: hypothetical protein DWI67_00910 [Chloroflexota bacterium]
MFATWWLGAALLQIGKKELESNSFWALETSGKMVNFCLDSHSSLWYYLVADKSADLKGAVFAKKYLADNRVPLALLVCTSRCEGFASAF